MAVAVLVSRVLSRNTYCYTRSNTVRFQECGSRRFIEHLLPSLSFVSKRTQSSLSYYQNTRSPLNSNLKNLIVSPRLNKRCLSLSYCQHIKRKESPFPKETGVDRHEAEQEKLNRQADPRIYMKELPWDSGIKADSINQIMGSYTPKTIKTIKTSKDFFAASKLKFQALLAYGQVKWKDNKPFKLRQFARSGQKKFIDLNMDLQLKPTLGIEKRMAANGTLMVIRSLKEKFQSKKKKIHWRFVKELKRPKVVHLMAGKASEIYVAQVTVRMYTEQIICVRDRYDRLLSGSLKNPKKVVDYVVFERDMSDPYGEWRICGKIHPNE